MRVGYSSQNGLHTYASASTCFETVKNLYALLIIGISRHGNPDTRQYASLPFQ